MSDVELDIYDLKQRAEAYRVELEARPKAPVISGPNGPVGMILIEPLIAVLESQHRRIAALEEAILRKRPSAGATP